MKSCDCEKCKNCCWRNPGWFGSKEEIIQSAKTMKCETLKEFANKYLVKEYWAGKESITVPAPRRNSNKFKDDEHAKYWMEEVAKNQGFHNATWGHNLINGFACVFLNDNNKCKIHKSKPIECAKTFGCRANGFKREQVLNYWEKHQDWIKEKLEEVN